MNLHPFEGTIDHEVIADLCMNLHPFEGTIDHGKPAGKLLEVLRVCTLLKRLWFTFPFTSLFILVFVKVTYNGGRYFGSGVQRECTKGNFQLVAIGGEKVNVCFTRCISKNRIRFHKSKQNIYAMYT
jgi:hypothetical protein